MLGPVKVARIRRSPGSEKPPIFPRDRALTLVGELAALRKMLPSMTDREGYTALEKFVTKAERIER
jgi:hypothetical protein